MGIDISTYRQRIGAFQSQLRPSKYRKFGKLDKAKYSRFTSGSDLHFRVLLMLTLIGAQVIIAEGLVLCARKYNFVLFEVNCSYMCTNYISNISSGLHRTTTIPFEHSNINQYSCFSQRLLILSSDIELNPGPLSDKDEILREIRASKADLIEEIKTVKHDIRSINKEVANMKRDQVQIKTDVSDIHLIQSNLEVRITDLEQDVDTLKQDKKTLQDDKETLQLDIEYLSDQLDRKTEIINNLDKDVEHLEAYSRRDTLRVFGLPETINETYENLKEYVISSVLKVACPHIDWSPEDIVRTHRVGNENSTDTDSPRILLIKFLHWDKKMSTIKGRENLRQFGLRVGDDLTRRQRAALKRLSKSGKAGYFYKGQLFIRDPKPTLASDDNTENNKTYVQTRTFVKALRKSVPVPVFEQAGALNNEPMNEQVHEKTENGGQNSTDIQGESNELNETMISVSENDDSSR